MSITVYSWRIRDMRTGKWRTLRCKMTERDALDWATMESVELEKAAALARTGRQSVDLLLERC